jgi:hypothetical protein
MNTYPVAPSTPRRPAARHLVALAAAAALGASALLTSANGRPAVVLAQSATPTPLPTSSLAQLPDTGQIPRPEPMGDVHLESSINNCVRNAPGESGEAAISGVMVRLKDTGGNIVRQQLSNAYGIFDLYDANVGLAEGNYQLEVVPPGGSGWSLTCAQPGTAQNTVYSSPVGLTSPGYYPATMKVTIGLQ